MRVAGCRSRDAVASRARDAGCRSQDTIAKCRGIGESLAYANGVGIAWPLAYLWRIHSVPWRTFVTPLS